MQRSASENLFLGFLKKSKATLPILLLVTVGIIFIVISGFQGETRDESEEDRLAEVCSGIEGVGRCSVVLNIKDGEVVSCAVLCEGGDLPTVKGEIKSLVSSLYGIGYNRIIVLKADE